MNKLLMSAAAGVALAATLTAPSAMAADPSSAVEIGISSVVSSPSGCDVTWTVIDTSGPSFQYWQTGTSTDGSTELTETVREVSFEKEVHLVPGQTSYIGAQAYYTMYRISTVSSESFTCPSA